MEKVFFMMNNNVLVSFGESTFTEQVGPQTFRIHFNRVAFTIDSDELVQVNRMLEKTVAMLSSGAVPDQLARVRIGEVCRSAEGFYLLRIYNCTLCLCEKMLRCFGMLCSCTLDHCAPEKTGNRDNHHETETDIEQLLDSIVKEVFDEK